MATHKKNTKQLTAFLKKLKKTISKNETNTNTTNNSN